MSGTLDDQVGRTNDVSAKLAPDESAPALLSRSAADYLSASKQTAEKIMKHFGVNVDAPAEQIQIQLADKMMNLFDFVVSDRSNYYIQNPDKVPDKNSAGTIIQYYAAMNAAISGGAGLVPGPLGMLAVVPEIAAVVRNQLAMIYDLGMAYGKPRVLTRELLAGVLITAMGASAGTVFIMHGSRVMVKRVALRSFQKLVVILAGRVTQQALKSAISKWLPILGATAMAVWSNHLTRKVGKRAIEIFECDVEILQDDGAEAESSVKVPGTAQILDDAVLSHHAPSGPNIELLKVQSLISLLKVDGAIRPQEREYIITILANASLSDSERSDLRARMDVPERFDVPFDVIAKSPDLAIAHLIDMVTLAKRDGEFHIAEKLYIKQAGKRLGFPESEIDEAMSL